MALSIKDPEADRLARELARRTGKSLTAAIVDALRAAVEAEERRYQERLEAIREISRRYSSLPVLDDRPEEEILGYDDMMLGNDKFKE